MDINWLLLIYNAKSTISALRIHLPPATLLTSSLYLTAERPALRLLIRVSTLEPGNHGLIRDKNNFIRSTQEE